MFDFHGQGFIVGSLSESFMQSKNYRLKPSYLEKPQGQSWSITVPIESERGRML